MIVALLGGTGLVGSHIAYALRAVGHRVRLAYRSEGSLRHAERVFRLYEGGAGLLGGLDCQRVDLLDLQEVTELVSGCDAVVHAAAPVTLGARGRGAGQARGLASVVVDACLSAGVSGVVHVGSISVLPAGLRGMAIGESATHQDFGRLGDYALGKSDAEREMQRGVAEGLRVSLLNPGVVLAPPTRRGSSAELVRWARRGSRFYTGGRLAWVDVRDVAQCVVCALERGIPPVRCTLVGGTTDYRTLLDAFAARYGGARASYEIPYGVACLIAGAVSFLSHCGVRFSGLDSNTILAGYSRNSYDSSVAQTEFGLSFRSLSESLDFIAGCVA